MQLWWWGLLFLKNAKIYPKKNKDMDFPPQIKNILLYFCKSKTCHTLQICSLDPSSPVEFNKLNVAKWACNLKAVKGI